MRARGGSFSASKVGLERTSAAISDSDRTITSFVPFVPTYDPNTRSRQNCAENFYNLAMNQHIKAKLAKLRTDFAQIKGEPFSYFHCPILFVDEDVPLSKAHIVNRAFTDSAKNWTIQRTDVDNFYGSAFEADFVALNHVENFSIEEALSDEKLGKSFRPRILLDGSTVKHFHSRESVPRNFTRLDIELESRVVQIGIKMTPGDFFAATNRSWEVEVSKDVRISALVSLIKAGQLTLFEMLGYRYALSAGGYFVGRQILGEFFMQNRGNSRTEILESARPYFREFTHMVRPLQSTGLEFQGTISDQLMLLCGGMRSPWALIVFVRTAHIMNAVLMPIFDDPDAVARFLNFLMNDNEIIEANLCRFDDDYWNIDVKEYKISWPKSGILYPDS